MFYYLKWGVRLTLLLFLVAVLHYTLPQRDIVRIVDTQVLRQDFGENSWFWASPDTGADGTVSNRDVRFIETVQTNGRVMVYRNEDTGWGWPPYFKLDSSNLQAEASDLVSTKDDPQWVIMRHYGWRWVAQTIFPNAISVTPTDDPDQRLIPWFNIVFLVLFTVVLLTIWRLWVNFREARIDPLFRRADAAWDGVEDRSAAARDGVRGWLGTWRGKGRK